MVQFYRVASVDPVVRFLTDKLTTALARGPVTWLVPGGSAIPIVAAVARLIASADLSKLTVSPTDERFGSVGHPDSNWQQLANADFTLPAARLVPVLQGQNIEVTTQQFATELATILDRTAYRLGFFGMGADGHTAGMLPNSPAVRETEAFAAHYKADDFNRITMAPKAFGYLDEAVLYAVGEAKWPMLDKLEEEVPVAQMPAQLLKVVPQVTIFNDHKGGME